MKTKYLAGASFFALFIIGFLVTVVFFTVRHTINQVIVTPNPGSGIGYNSPTPTPDPLAPYGVLLLGLRGDNSRGGFLTDTMILAKIEPHTKNITLISIPRDLWVPLPLTPEQNTYFKINAAYAIGLDDRTYPNKANAYKGLAGGGTLAKDIVQSIFGFPVRYFVSLDFEGFKKSIDVLGGVDVVVTRSFEDPYFPITGLENDTCGKSDEDVKALTATMSGDLLEHEFPCRYENLKFDKGTIHMDGETALKFARSRHALTDGTDFARSNRQKEVILAVKDKVLQLGFITKAIPFMQSLAGNIRTDIPLDTMRAMASQVSDYKTYTVTSLALSTENALMQTYSSDRQYILIPKSGIDNWQSVRDYIETQGKTPAPTATPALKTQTKN